MIDDEARHEEKPIAEAEREMVNSRERKKPDAVLWLVVWMFVLYYIRTSQGKKIRNGHKRRLSEWWVFISSR